VTSDVNLGSHKGKAVPRATKQRRAYLLPNIRPKLKSNGSPPSSKGRREWLRTRSTPALLRQFFLTIPCELDKAAILDGTNPVPVLWHVIILLSHPALETVAILSDLAAWNRFPRSARLLKRFLQIHTGARAVRNCRAYCSHS
jgi:hypothetical protein